MYGWLPGLSLLVLVAACPAAFANVETTYVRHCATCHGSAGAGAVGMPDLTNGSWQYGGSPEAIEYTIANGRQSTMPALGMALGAGVDETGLDQVVSYVQSLSGAESDSGVDLDAGATLFMMFCASCHGEGGQGTPSLGAPDLTDDIWLYGGESRTIRDVVSNGRSNEMPAFGDTLNSAQIRALGEFVQRMSEDES